MTYTVFFKDESGKLFLMRLIQAQYGRRDAILKTATDTEIILFLKC